MAQNLVLCGASAAVFVNAQPYGRVAAVSWDVDQPASARHGIDTLEPTEVVRGPVTCTGTLVVYRLHGDGGAEGARLTATRRDLWRERNFSLLVVDLVTDTTILRVDRATVTKQQWRIDPRALTMGTIGWIGTLYDNETEPAPA